MNPYQKELSRPPVYNPEDYALSIKKWTSRPIVNGNEQNDTAVQTSFVEREMSLRQFSSISDLLNKLKTDLRLAYISFVQEFVADPIDGITLLLELLRTIQSKDTNQHSKAASALHRRTLLDENSCLQCIRYSLRCPETTRRLAMASTGLFSLTVCIMSSVSKSRIIALELLTKICCYSIAGHNAVSEAMSTMRLRFGEPVRFRFLVSMLNGAASDLLLSGLRFINSFIETSPKKQIHLYVQAELEQAGLNIQTLKDMMPSKDTENEAINEEFTRWSKLYIDVEVLKNNHSNKCKEVVTLKEKIVELESQIKILLNEKQSLISGNGYKNRSSKLNISTSDSCSNSIEKSFTFKTHINYPNQRGENSTPAEDEGISSSDQDESEENVNHQNTLNSYMYGMQNNKALNTKYEYNYETASMEPTIAEVMEGFQNIINDAKNHDCLNKKKESNTENKMSNRNASFEYISKAKIAQEENDIIPSKILPEPPKKSRSLHFLHENIETNPFFEDESVDNSNCSCSSQECCSSAESEHEYSKIEYLRKDDSYLKRDVQINGQKNVKPKGLKRSETFHYLQNKNPPTNVLIQKRRGKSEYSNETFFTNKNKTINPKNKNYIIQNSCNSEKEMKNKNVDLKSNTKIIRSVSTKPTLNDVKPSNLSYFHSNAKINPVTYFLNKPNGFPTNASNFTLKRHNNAGLYSGKNHLQNLTNSNNNRQITTAVTNYSKRCSSSPKEINYKAYSGNIMDFPSGLY